MTLKRLLVVGVFPILCAACTENAIFELTIELPPSGPPTWVRVQARRAGGHEFEDSWQGGGDPDPVQLDATERTDFETSLVTEAEGTDVHVKVTFCTEETCTPVGLGSAAYPELWIKIEHPFYEGHFTSYTYQDIVEVPTTVPSPGSNPALVGLCSIEGCLGGDANGNYCHPAPDDTIHICAD